MHLNAHQKTKLSINFIPHSQLEWPKRRKSLIKSDYCVTPCFAVLIFKSSHIRSSALSSAPNVSELGLISAIAQCMRASAFLISLFSLVLLVCFQLFSQYLHSSKTHLNPSSSSAISNEREMALPYIIVIGGSYVGKITFYVSILDKGLSLFFHL